MVVGPSSMTVKYSLFVSATELRAKRGQGNLGKWDFIFLFCGRAVSGVAAPFLIRTLRPFGGDVI